MVIMSISISGKTSCLMVVTDIEPGDDDHHHQQVGGHVVLGEPGDQGLHGVTAFGHGVGRAGGTHAHAVGHVLQVAGDRRSPGARPDG